MEQDNEIKKIPIGEEDKILETQGEFEIEFSCGCDVDCGYETE